LQAVELLTDQFEKQLRSMLVSIKDDLKQGSSLADALAKYPKTFDVIYLQLVRAGEASGQLELILDRLTQYMERQEEIAKKVSGALREPMINLAIVGAVVTFLLVKIVPEMAANFATQGKELPLPTRILMGVSDFITGHYLILIFFIGVVVSVYQYWGSTVWGKRQKDQLKLKLPLIKYLSKTNAVVQFSYTFGMLLEGGVNLPEALDIVVRIIDNRVLAQALDQARDKIVKQGKIAQYLKETKIFPPIAIYLLETGENSGELDTMLLHVAKNYEEEVTELTERLTEALKPIIFVVMSIVVGSIIIAIALPIMQMGQLASA
jgi:type II secretory pathway component PulF